MKREQLQRAFVLHRRPYRETSFLVELLTQDHGRMSVIARGVRKRQSSTQGVLQPFNEILASWAGKGELMTLTHVEMTAEPIRLQGECLFAGFYLNELLTALLEKWDPHTQVYAAYATTIRALQTGVLDEKILRSFELRLLEELGYGLLPKTETLLQQAFSLDKHYRFISEQGFVPCEDQAGASMASNLFSGNMLYAIARQCWDEPGSLQEAKRLIRLVLTPLLGMRQIHSRQLFMINSD